MYCPPESGNIDPNYANAAHANKEITAPAIHTPKNKTGFGNGPAISFAVRKIEDPMTPLTSSRTESRSESPRTRLGCACFNGPAGRGVTTGEASIDRVIRSRAHPATQAVYHNAGK